MPQSYPPRHLAGNMHNLPYNGKAAGSPTLLNHRSGKQLSPRNFTFPQVEFKNPTLRLSRTSEPRHQGDYRTPLEWSDQPGTVDPTIRNHQDPVRKPALQPQNNLFNRDARIAELKKEVVVLRSQLRIQQALKTVSSERISALSFYLRAAVEDIEAVWLELGQGIGLDLYRKISSAFLNAAHYREVLDSTLPELMVSNVHNSPAHRDCGETVWDGVRQQEQPMRSHTSRVFERSFDSRPSSSLASFETESSALESLTLPPIHAANGREAIDASSQFADAQEPHNNYAAEMCFDSRPSSSLASFETASSDESLTLPPIYAANGRAAIDASSQFADAQEPHNNYAAENQELHEYSSCNRYPRRLEGGLGFNELHGPKKSNVRNLAIKAPLPFQERFCANVGHLEAPAESSATASTHGTTANIPSANSSSVIMMSEEICGCSACQTYASSGPSMETKSSPGGFSPAESLPTRESPNFVLDIGHQDHSDQTHVPNSFEAYSPKERCSPPAGKETPLEESWLSDDTWDLPRNFSDDAISVRLASQKMQFHIGAPMYSTVQPLNTRSEKLCNDVFGQLLEAPTSQAKKRKSETPATDYCNGRLDKRPRNLP